MEEIETKPEEMIEEQPKTGFLEKLKTYKFKILVGILGFFVFVGAVFGAYKFGQRQVQPGPGPTPTLKESAYKCVEESSLNCAQEIELSFQCTEEYQTWARENCPGWKKYVYCEESRPEVCTMECIQNPPYICGSDGKSYCNVCGACADPTVEWYIIQDTPCKP